MFSTTALDSACSSPLPPFCCPPQAKAPVCLHAGQVARKGVRPPLTQGCAEPVFPPLTHSSPQAGGLLRERTETRREDVAGRSWTPAWVFLTPPYLCPQPLHLSPPVGVFSVLQMPKHGHPQRGAGAVSNTRHNRARASSDGERGPSWLAPPASGRALSNYRISWRAGVSGAMFQHLRRGLVGNRSCVSLTNGSL